MGGDTKRQFFELVCKGFPRAPPNSIQIDLLVLLLLVVGGIFCLLAYSLKSSVIGLMILGLDLKLWDDGAVHDSGNFSLQQQQRLQHLNL